MASVKDEPAGARTKVGAHSTEGEADQPDICLSAAHREKSQSRITEVWHLGGYSPASLKGFREMENKAGK